MNTSQLLFILVFTSCTFTGLYLVCRAKGPTLMGFIGISLFLSPYAAAIITVIIHYLYV